MGYGKGGILTEAVRRRPYSVVLLDEVEKAHPDVLEIFYQVFDKGQMKDGEGREPQNGSPSGEGPESMGGPAGASIGVDPLDGGGSDVMRGGWR